MANITITIKRTISALCRSLVAVRAVVARFFNLNIMSETLTMSIVILVHCEQCTYLNIQETLHHSSIDPSHGCTESTL